MPPFVVACLSAGQRALIVRWGVEVDMGFGTKPSGKWGATILICFQQRSFFDVLLQAQPSAGGSRRTPQLHNKSPKHPVHPARSSTAPIRPTAGRSGFLAHASEERSYP